ncbi:hypothetical protein [Hymenobacter jeollabukensis]|uniref:Uncharacterized protein n=1 Tax=Hymenobacter jeollabukensis TaxID=2025313 RepID=A0A5R8WKA8_9BACT|nr:hypothetical protein [Hymenobacter jeollabukensis]TLM88963.1 hypothetical protein FDY95_22540 [Hymenobacter jeollabukensis]
MALELLQRNGLQGLRNGSQLVLPVEQDIVWPLGHNWWAYRRDAICGVIAPSGQLVTEELPASFSGFVPLSEDDELSCVLEDDATVVAFIRREFPNPHLYFGALCAATNWLADEVLTPAWWQEETQPATLDLPCCDGRSLTLRADGTWRWLDQNIFSSTTLYRTSTAQWQFVSNAHLLAADEYDLLNWRLALTGETPETETWFGKRVAQVQDELELSNYLDEVLSEQGIASQAAQRRAAQLTFQEFNPADLPLSVRTACETHLQQVAPCELGPEQLEQLIRLAWLWANGYVFYDEADGFHWVDGRYSFDNAWFDNQIIDNIRLEYELSEIEPLLRFS